MRKIKFTPANAVVIVRKSSKSHRIDVHRHADKFLEKEAERLRMNTPRPIPQKNPVITYLEYLTNGLESMFKTIKP